MSGFKIGDDVFVVLHKNYANLGDKRIAGIKYKGKVVMGSQAEGWVGVSCGDTIGYLHLSFGKHSKCSDFDIELVQDEKESTSAWLKENKWFIRTGNPEKSKLVQEWLFEHDCEWLYGKNVQSDFKDTMLTNTDCVGEKGNFIMFSTALDKKNAQEITLEFETVVKSVKLPELAPKKTEQQLRIGELEATISKAQEQVAKLKEEIK